MIRDGSVFAANSKPDLSPKAFTERRLMHALECGDVRVRPSLREAVNERPHAREEDQHDAQPLREFAPDGKPQDSFGDRSNFVIVPQSPDPLRSSARRGDGGGM
jgi:hypothetical protein